MDRADYNSYQRQYQAERHRRRKQAAIDQLGGKCVVCGSTENLHFDHIDPNSKTYTIGRIWTHSEDKLQSELAKCQLLCWSDHKIKSIKNHEYGGGSNRIDLEDADHGTSIMYCKFKCRCDACKDWKRSSRKHGGIG